MAASLKRMLLAAAATLLLAGPAWAQVSYRWVDDASGEYVYSPTPPDDEDQPYVMMRNGLIVETYEGLERLERPGSEAGGPEVTEAELARREAEKQRKADALLLLQYRTFEDLDSALEAELGNLRYDENHVDGTYESLERSLHSHIGAAADRQRAGLEVTDADIARIEGLRDRMRANRKTREELAQREVNVRAEFEAKRQRLLYLKDQRGSP